MRRIAFYWLLASVIVIGVIGGAFSVSAQDGVCTCNEYPGASPWPTLRPNSCKYPPTHPLGNDTFPCDKQTAGDDDDSDDDDDGGGIGGGLAPDCIADQCQFGDFVAFVQRIIDFLLFLAIPISAVLFAYAGFKMVTSAGNPKSVGEAKKIFSNAFIGLVIALSAWLIVSFVTNFFIGKDANEAFEEAGGIQP